MDESEVMSLIAEGEASGKVDYKRELHLDKPEEKAELIKDVISLANSAPGDKGYLLIGVADDKYIVGIKELEEERIQQIVHSHIRPPVVLKCQMVPVSVPGLPVIGVIEINATERPHRVTVPIGKLKQDDVFVRHGSITERATLEELRYFQSENQHEKQYTRLLQCLNN